MFDLTNNLLYCQHWGPLSLPSPYADELPQAERLHSDLEYGQAEEADMKLDPSILGGTEGS